MNLLATNRGALLVALWVLAATRTAAADINFEILGFTRDGTTLVYRQIDATRDEGADVATIKTTITFELQTGRSQEYLTSITGLGREGDEVDLPINELPYASDEERRRLRAMPNQAAFTAWQRQHPYECLRGRSAPDGKEQVEVALKGRGVKGRWDKDRYELQGDRSFTLALSVKRGERSGPPFLFQGSPGYHDQLGNVDAACWSPDGKRFTWVIHHPYTGMRDPGYDGVIITADDAPPLDAEAARAKVRAARAANLKGMKLYRAKDWPKALAEFKKAVAANGSYVVAHYNLACVASLLKDRATALAELKWLAASKDPEAAQKLAQARKDADLAFMMADEEGRRLLEATPAAK